MEQNLSVVIIPALNEEESIGEVLDHIPKNFKSHVIVVDNGSTDKTALIATKKGAHVAHESYKGYGAACLTGIKFAKEKFNPKFYIFLDSDYSDYPEEINDLFHVLIKNNLDLVIGSRMINSSSSLMPQARFGNRLACFLMGLRFGYYFTDLGPMRIITAKALEHIQMVDKNFGWTVEMQIKALKYGLKVGEYPVQYRKRIGNSKITGTFKGTIMASYKILWTLFRYAI